MSNITDDFLNGLVVDPSNTVGEVKDESTPNLENQPKTETKVEDKVFENTNDLPDLVGSDYPAEYVRVVNRIKIQYDLLPKLNYNAIYEELGALTIKANPTPTLEVLSDELFRVQAAKDRLSEILLDVIKCYNFKKRAVDILKDSWGKFTLEKNTEGRKGDSTFRLSHFLTDFSATEALCKSCDHIFKNLDGLQDNLSRRITIWQMLLKVREGRMSLPDYDFDKEAKSDGDMFKEKVKSDEESTCELREF